MEKYTQKHVPEESTLRKNYVPLLYDETIQKVRVHIANHYVYIIVDETTDARGKYVANLIIGALTPEKEGKPYLIASVELEVTNAASICSFTNDALIQFYKGESFSDKVLLFVSDAAPYMIRAGKNLKAFYRNMIHVTCLAHGLHRLCEKVRECFDDVNKLISWARKIFLKSPARISLYKEKMKCELPPDVVITRWGTWIKAASFFAVHLPNFAEVISELPDDSQHIGKLKTLIRKKNLPTDLAFIQTYFSFLPEKITTLETRGLPLHDQVQVIEEVRRKIQIIPGSRGYLLQKKLEDVLSKNEGFALLRELSMSFTDTSYQVTTTISRDPQVLSAYAFAPLVSVDLERSFAAYKLILSDRRHQFTQENVAKHLVVMYNTNLL